jgi:hypothetical protein
VALAIKAGGSALIKSTTITYAMVGGILVKLAAGDMPALTGISIPDGSKQMIGFAIDVSGALTLVAGRQGTTIGNVGMPTKPEGTVMLGLALIENGTGSTFTGGTTPIDTASLTVTYFNLTTAIEPLSTI